jgi:hypothetical protein
VRPGNEDKFINTWPHLFFTLANSLACRLGPLIKYTSRVIILYSVCLTAALYTGCAVTPENPTAAAAVPSINAPTTSPVAPAGNITLADASRILDLLPLLPKGFHRADDPDAANTLLEEGYMVAGPGWSEAEVFVSENPFQFVRAYMNIADSDATRSSLDRLFADETSLIVFVEKNLVKQLTDCSAVPDVIESAVVPNILGELALYGQATRTNAYINIGFDAILFRQGNVYVFLCSFYSYPRETNLPDLGTEVQRRISTGKQ